jgi:hypothetical protein
VAHAIHFCGFRVAKTTCSYNATGMAFRPPNTAAAFSQPNRCRSSSKRALACWRKRRIPRKLIGGALPTSRDLSRIGRSLRMYRVRLQTPSVGANI